MTYRDDLDAALAHNHALARRVSELEQALEKRPRSPDKSRAPSSRVVYAAPATYFPCVRLYARYVTLSWRALANKLPSARTVVPPPSNIIVLELLRRVFLLAWIPLAYVLKLVWFVLGAVWFALAVAMEGVATVLASVVALPFLVLASVRTRRADAGSPRGVGWADVVTDEAASLYAALAPLGLLIAVPIAALWLRS